MTIRSKTKTKKSSSMISKVGKTIKKGKKKVVFGAKVVRAGIGIARDVSNPFKMGKVAVGAVRGKGIVYPGTNYIGPGNPLNAGKPVSSGDRAAMQHDYDYDRLLKKGVKPKKLYAGFSEADKRLMKRSDITTKHGLVTYGGMAVKKGLYKIGLTGKLIKD